MGDPQARFFCGGGREPPEEAEAEAEAEGIAGPGAASASRHRPSGGQVAAVGRGGALVAMPLVPSVDGVGC